MYKNVCQRAKALPEIDIIQTALPASLQEKCDGWQILCSPQYSGFLANLKHASVKVYVDGRILLTSALSDLSISAVYLCHLLIALSVK